MTELIVMIVVAVILGVVALCDDGNDYSKPTDYYTKENYNEEK